MRLQGLQDFLLLDLSIEFSSKATINMQIALDDRKTLLSARIMRPGRIRAYIMLCNPPVNNAID